MRGGDIKEGVIRGLMSSTTLRTLTHQKPEEDVLEGVELARAAAAHCRGQGVGPWRQWLDRTLGTYVARRLGV